MNRKVQQSIKRRHKNNSSANSNRARNGTGGNADGGGPGRNRPSLIRICDRRGRVRIARSEHSAGNHKKNETEDDLKDVLIVPRLGGHQKRNCNDAKNASESGENRDPPFNRVAPIVVKGTEGRREERAQQTRSERKRCQSGLRNPGRLKIEEQDRSENDTASNAHKSGHKTGRQSRPRENKERLHSYWSPRISGYRSGSIRMDSASRTYSS